MFFSLALMSEAALRNWLKGLLVDGTRMRLMVQVLHGGVTVGIIGLERIDYRNQSAELAGLLIDPLARGHGWGTHAARALIRYAFEDLNLCRLAARIPISSHAPQRVAEKTGFTREGIARQALLHNGDFEDVVFMSILREVWKTRVEL
jgi:RimJ/RimL family protein N-acetyltransferase